MILKKRKPNHSINGFIKYLRERIKTFSIVITSLIFIAALGVFLMRLGFIYYPNIKNFLLASLQTNIQVVPNYIKGILVEFDNVYIDMDHENFQRLSYNRKRAIEKDKRIITSDESYVKAKISLGDKKIGARIRLKGDIVDHLEGDKWSFRVKIKGDESIFGMRRFSLQSPKRSAWINEWLLHQWYKYEGLISLRYEYVKLFINGKNYGVYALEESFDKELIENNHRREGPIIKFDESLLHDHNKFDLSTRTSETDAFYSANIKAFRFSKIKKDSILYNQFLLGQKLLDDFRSRKISVSEAFDIKKIAKLYALTNITDSPHSLRWKNVRFYYNPIINKLEMIGYNAYGSALNIKSRDNMSIKNYHFINIVDEFHDLFFRDYDFIKYYTKYLRQMSNKEYIDEFLSSIRSHLLKNLSKIYNEFPAYFFDPIHRYTSQEKINNFLEPGDYPLKIKLGFGNNNQKSKYNIKIANNTFLPIKLNLISVVSKNNKIKLEQILPAKYSSKHLDYFKVECNSCNDDLIDSIITHGIKIDYHILGLKNENKVTKITREDFLIDQHMPKLKSTLGLFHGNKEMFDVNNDTLFINKGDWSLDQSLIFPSGLTILVGPGTKFDLINSSMFISYSQLILEGSKESPIKFFSSDKSGRGFLCIGVENRSLLKNVIFSNLDRPRSKSWALTGSVNFYESPVDIYDCVFSDNYCEDVLNIIRTDFSINNTNFYNIFSDAFDGDFVKGVIRNSNFNLIGNDAIDISGGDVSAYNIIISNAGDKGFSAGENSRLLINNSEVNSSKIAIASKDFSYVNVNNLKISSAEVAFAAYQKKPEYGPATININQFKSNDNIIKKYLIENKSTIIVSGEKIKPNSTNVRSILYDN
tara:strand:- start:1757 stop:4369 length:2613 start_codon:yes stop_codon:yes gene_type:complete